MAIDLTRELEIGFEAQRAGNLPKAEQYFKKVLKSDAANKHALNLMGMLCVNAGRSTEAVEFIERALAVDAEDSQAHANLGLAYKDLGQIKSALKHLAESVRLQPIHPVVFNNLGNVLRLLNQPGKAIRAYEKAIKLYPDFPECWSNLAAALNESDQPEPGLKAALRAIELDPALAQAYNNQGDVLLSMARYEDAMVSYEKAVELSPQYAAAIINMARTQRDMDQPEAGLKTLEIALKIEPNNPDAHHVMGVLQEQMGDREKAAEQFLQALEIAPEMTVSHYNLAQIRGRKSSDEELAAMLTLWQRDEQSHDSKMHLAYGLYRVYEQRDLFDEAFGYLKAGNQLKANESTYKDSDVAKYLDGSVEGVANVIERLQGMGGDLDSHPVFVLGMPRSGTSLTEQVLASHSEIIGAGEVSFAFDTIHRIKELVNKPYPMNLADITAEQLIKLGNYYMSCHRDENLSKTYVVDKSPLNFQYLGLLALALPNARFIHCHRDPVANCFAIHRIPFDKRQSYAHDLSALGQYYSRYSRMMNSWHSLFPGRILNVQYEDTVEDIEAQSRRLLGFLDLPFEEGVLSFYATKRVVKTPSASQVREPIYKSSIAAWKKYEKHLGPLIENLEVGLSE
jgi:tetratricopeptide (TPR) repeat protein